MVSVELVSKKLKNIFKRLYNIELDNLPKNIIGKNFFGEEFRFSAVDLLCLYMEVEKEFEIVIPQHFVALGKFNSIKNIEELILEQLQESA